MVLDLINKALTLLLWMSVLNVFRHLYYFIQNWFMSTPEAPIKYKLTDKKLFLLGVSISYILATIYH